jgi:uncharacterized membrane protein
MPDSTGAQTLVGISFSDAFRAQEFLTAAAGLAATGRMTLEDAVVVHRGADGHTHVRETKDLQPGRSALSGAVWAGLFGLLLGGPVGWLAGAAIGAGTGAVTAKVVDLGIPDEWVDWFREAVQPDTTIVALLVKNLDREALADELERFEGAHLVYANVEGAWQDKLRQALGETTASAEPSERPATGPD